MKIVSVMNTTSRGGAEFAALQMLDALSDRGHETVLMSDRPEVAEGFGVRAEALDIGPKLSTRSWRSLMLRWPAYLARLREALERESPYDVLLLHYKKEQLMARFLPARLRPAVIWAEWGPIPFPMRRGLPRLMYLSAARRANAVMAISAGTRDSVCEVGVPEEKVTVVPNVVRTDEIDFSAAGRARVRGELGIPEDAFVVGCISRFHPKKRNDVVVEAVKRLGGEPHLILAGAGETEAELRELARPLGDRAHFVATPGEDVSDFLSAFDVLVFCPSPTEGAPRAVILGMLARRPCVSTGAEGVADLIAPGTGEILTPENDPASLAASLEGYAGDPERREREGEEARRRAVETYSAPVVAERIEELWISSGVSRNGSRP
jgi:glycosyltransferase involved in cell wall biosynthesis